MTTATETALVLADKLQELRPHYGNLPAGLLELMAAVLLANPTAKYSGGRNVAHDFALFRSQVWDRPIASGSGSKSQHALRNTIAHNIKHFRFTGMMEARQAFDGIGWLELFVVTDLGRAIFPILYGVARADSTDKGIVGPCKNRQDLANDLCGFSDYISLLATNASGTPVDVSRWKSARIALKENLEENGKTVHRFYLAEGEVLEKNTFKCEIDISVADWGEKFDAAERAWRRAIKVVREHDQAGE